MLYRMQVKATCCFDVVAATPEEAIELAKKMLADGDVPDDCACGDDYFTVFHMAATENGPEIASVWKDGELKGGA